MNTFTNYRNLLVVLLAALSFSTARAQNNPVASALVMSSLMPVANLNAVPTPEENAHFYDDTCKDLGHSLAWMQEANAVQPKYWNLYTEARIHLKMNNYPAALAIALKAKELANTATNHAYVRLSDEVIKLTNRTQPGPSPANLAANNALASTK